MSLPILEWVSSMQRLSKSFLEDLLPSSTSSTFSTPRRTRNASPKKNERRRRQQPRRARHLDHQDRHISGEHYSENGIDESENQEYDDDEDTEDEERVSLVDRYNNNNNNNNNGSSTGLRKNRVCPPSLTSSTTNPQRLRGRTTTTATANGRSTSRRQPPTPSKTRGISTTTFPATLWASTRIRYLSLTAFSALLTFGVLRRESKALHWQEFSHLLEPHLIRDQPHCYRERRHGEREKCRCPDPSVPLVGSPANWKTYHSQLVKIANTGSPSKGSLDIVFLGDDIVERWQGTTELGTKSLGKDMSKPFQDRFDKRHGGHLEGLALGASSDTGPNLLWHIQNGMIDNLNPKLWFISIGSNDLFEEKCTDKFVVASILNVVKAITDRKPNAHFIIHGILPRKDDTKSKTEFLQKKWKYAQKINTEIRKFCEHSSQLFYMQAGTLFLKEASKEWKGRRTIDEQLLEDGIYPTKKGMEVWGDYVVKRVQTILQDIDGQKYLKKGQGRQLSSFFARTSLFRNWKNETVQVGTTQDEGANESLPTLDES